MTKEEIIAKYRLKVANVDSSVGGFDEDDIAQAMEEYGQLLLSQQTGVSGSLLLSDAEIRAKAEEYMTEVQSNALAYDRNTKWTYSDVYNAFVSGLQLGGNDR